jgi:hypothetical protein
MADDRLVLLGLVEASRCFRIRKLDEDGPGVRVLALDGHLPSSTAMKRAEVRAIAAPSSGVMKPDSYSP